MSMRWVRWWGATTALIGLAGGIALVVLGQPVTGAMVATGTALPGLLMVLVGAGWDRPLAGPDELRRYGRPAPATVVAVDGERLDGRGGRTARVALRVRPNAERAFSTRRELELPGGRVPAVGEEVVVRFDPHRRDAVVLLGPEEARRAEAAGPLGGVVPASWAGG